MNKYLKALIFALAGLLLPAIALAAEGRGHRHEDGVPNVVLYQLLNFALFFILMFVLLRKQIVAYFADKDASFQEAVRKAQNAKATAEAQRKDIQNKLAELERSAAPSVEEARKASWAQHRIAIDEAHEISKRMKAEAQLTSNYETLRASEELREEFLAKSIAGAKKVLTEGMKENDQKRLQAEFVEKIQVAK